MSEEQAKHVRPESRHTGAVFSQMVGLAALMTGVYLLAGVGVALVVGGVLMVALATLREAGRV